MGLFGDEEEEEDWLSWMTTQEAAALSGYDIQHIRHLAREGKIGAVKRGRDWWIDYEEFMAYLDVMDANEDKRSGPKGKPNLGAWRKPLPRLDDQERKQSIQGESRPMRPV